MLNLYDYLTPLDSKRIENYITEWGIEDGYVGNDTYLRYWAENNKKLFHMLGGNLIVKTPYSYEKPESQLYDEINKIIRNRQGFFDDAYDELIKVKDKYNIDDYTYNNLWDCFRASAIHKDKVPNGVKFKAEDKKGTLQIQRDMKPIRAMQKIIQYFELTSLTERFEEFRVAHSMALNEKIVKGFLCISIHPLDFMTMSDNASDWSSCMSWVEQGCYHVGTVEMMNSNNVICAYLESKTPFEFGRRTKEEHKGEEWQWNNKKWRQLFYVTKDIIVGGKSYPYENEEFTKQIIDILRGLAKENLGWTYSFGPELYRDMIHIGSLYRMDRNRQWIRSKSSTKHNIIFDTKGMYNDMLNDQNRKYWCIRNKVKHSKIISYSGKAPCLCCMDDVVIDIDEYDYEYYEEGAYNERFDNVRSVICRSCLDDRYCDWCGNEGGYFNIYEVNGQRLCRSCWEKKVRECPDCGAIYETSESNRDNIIARLTDEPLVLQDVNHINSDVPDKKSKYSLLFMCPDCRRKLVDEGLVSQKIIKVDKSRHFYAWDREASLMVTNKVYNFADEFIQKHSYSSLSTPPVE